MRIVKIKDLKDGAFFVKKNAKIDENECVKESAVWVRGYYDRSTKTYSCCKFDDICNETFLKGTIEVITDFYF